MHKPYPGEPVLAEHDHDWADGSCQDPDCAALLIDEVEHEIVQSLDLGQRTVEDTYLDPIIALAQTIRGRTTCEHCQQFLLDLGEKDLAMLRDADSDYWMEEASATLEAWERRAGDYGLIGYTEEGTYWIAAQL